MSNGAPASPEQAVDEVLRLWLAGEAEEGMIRRLCELAGDPDEAHAREHLQMILEGYHSGMYLGSLLIGFSGVSAGGPPLYLIAFDRGYGMGVRQKVVFKILPLCVLAVLAFAAYKLWW